MHQNSHWILCFYLESNNNCISSCINFRQDDILIDMQSKPYPKQEEEIDEIDEIEESNFMVETFIM